MPVSKQPNSFDFTINRIHSRVIQVIFWLTVAFFCLSIPSTWLADWFGLESAEKEANWMFHTFGLDPGRLLSEPWTLITHMFMHGGVLHFSMNMIMLYMFYRSAREFFPGKTWLLVYFLSGIFGGLLFVALNPAGSIAVGASGGVMGLWGAAIAARLRYTRVPEDERPWQSDLTLKSLLGYLALQIVAEAMIPNVAHSAHAGGMAAGFVIGLLLNLSQQPRLVTSREGLFTIEAQTVKNPHGISVQNVTVTPTDKFDPSRDFLAVEFDNVDWLNRRSVWYEFFLPGVTKLTVPVGELVFLASSRQVGSETAAEYHKRTTKPVEKKEGSITVSSHAITIAMFAFLLLGYVNLTSPLVPIITLLAAAISISIWLQLLKNTIGEIKKPLRFYSVFIPATIVLAGVLFGCGWLAGDIRTGCRVILALTAGHLIQRFVVVPIVLRWKLSRKAQEA